MRAGDQDDRRGAVRGSGGTAGDPTRAVAASPTEVHVVPPPSQKLGLRPVSAVRSSRHAPGPAGSPAPATGLDPRTRHAVRAAAHGEHRRKLWARARVLPIVALLTLVVGAGCGPNALLSDLTPASVTIAPGSAEAVVRYRVEAPARFTAVVEDQAGRRVVLRDDQPRPPGEYALALDGTYAMAEGSVRRQALPSGTYTLTAVARDERGAAAERRAVLRITDADTQLPALSDIAALPAVISPYDPNYESETALAYGLDKAARVTLALLWPPGRRTVLRPPALREPGQYAERWNGLVGTRYPPDGTYRFEIEARDRAGNTVAQEGQITLAGTRLPDARVVRVSFTPPRLLYGEAIRVEITVRNVGPVVLRTHGPPPGFLYTSRDTFATVADGQYVDRYNYWRVGVDWMGGPAGEGGRYPYRWGFGHDLGPGEEVTVVGFIRLLQPYRTLRLYAGLIREGASYYVDRVGSHVVELVR